MRIYARPSWLLVGQILVDLGVVVWIALWWLGSRVIEAAISMIAAPVRQIAETAQSLAVEVTKAAGAAGKLPMVGDDLRRPLDTASGSVNSIATQASGQVQAIELTASVVGWACFLLPVLFVVALWLPARWRYALRTRAAAEMLQAPGAMQLLAMRALMTLPLPKLRQLSADPVGDWKRGDAVTIQALANAELKQLGMALPSLLSHTAMDAPR